MSKSSPSPKKAPHLREMKRNEDRKTVTVKFTDAEKEKFEQYGKELEDYYKEKGVIQDKYENDVAVLRKSKMNTLAKMKMFQEDFAKKHDLVKVLNIDHKTFEVKALKK